MSTVEALDWLEEKGRQELQSGQTDSARRRFQKILQMTRDSDRVEVANAGLAEVYLEEDNLFWAMDHIRRALKKAPGRSSYRYLKARIHLRREEWSQAADDALRSVEGNAECAAYYQLLAKAVYRCEGYSSARRFMEWAVECDPSSADIRLDFARIEIREGNFQRALKLLRNALEETPEEERILDSIRAIQENWKITGS